MGGVSGFRMCRKGWGCFSCLMVLPVEMKVYRVGKLFLGWIFGSTARRAGEEFQVSSQELPNDASWVLTLCISKSWLQLTTFANQLGTMNQSPKK